jgi:hypothetical protein
LSSRIDQGALEAKQVGIDIQLFLDLRCFVQKSKSLESNEDDQPNTCEITKMSHECGYLAGQVIELFMGVFEVPLNLAYPED